MQEMIEMAAEQQPFLVPAPPPPLKPPAEAGGGPQPPPPPPPPPEAEATAVAAAGPARGGPCGRGREAPRGPAGRPEEEDGVAELQRPRNGFQPHRAAGGKRRNSCNPGGGGGFKHPASKRRRRVNSECDPVLPSEFLLGGNIFDPLNLNSLLDEEVNRALNAETPKSSPLPAKGRDPVEILIPKDITDPLSLNAPAQDGDEALVLASPFKAGRKRHRHRGQQRGGGGGGGGGNPPGGEAGKPPPCKACGAEAACPTPQPYELNTAINCRDEVVSPLLPRREPPHPAAAAGCGNFSCPAAPPPASSSSGSSRHRKRRRTCSKSEGAKQHPQAAQPPPPGPRGGKGSPEKGKGSGKQQQAPPAKRRRQARKFQYGNYCKYYGYRNPSCEDARLRVMKLEWFQGKEVLDVGCNVGHLTLSIAKKWKPARVVGVDIDGSLIHSARQNIRHYLSEEIQAAAVAAAAQADAAGGSGPARPRAAFPVSLTASRGPIAAPRLPPDGADATEFPNNVIFVTGNYVLERDELLAAQRPEYDVVLCLSLTKWVHLNWGDEGLKRLFKRAFRHLRPGGALLLEPQPWSSYGKRKNLTETTYRNYYRIKLKPEQFPSYLTSPEVGFASYELVATPQNSSKGFQRPIYLFHKDR